MESVNLAAKGSEVSQAATKVDLNTDTQAAMQAATKADADAAKKADKQATESANSGKGNGGKDVAVVGNGTNGDTLLFLLPEEITIPPEDILDVRPWTTKHTTEKDLEELQKLAESMDEAAGGKQLQPVVVRYGSKGEYLIVDGRRRLAGVTLINAGKAKNDPPQRVKCIVSKDEDDAKKALGKAHRQSMIANIHRSDFSAMDLAQDIENAIAKYKWTGDKANENMAEYLKVSKATVVQYRKLLKLDKAIQEQIHDGKLSRDAAFALLAVAPEKRQEVIQVATQAAAGEAEKVEAKKEAAKAAGKSTKGTRAPKNAGKVKAAHVKAAARKVEGAEVKPQARTRKEIVEFFEGEDGPASGHEDGVPRLFIAEFLAWVKGGSSDRKLDKAWVALIEKAPKGTPKVEEDKKSAKAAGKGKK